MRRATTAAVLGAVLTGALAGCGGTGTDDLDARDRAEVLRVASDRLEALFSYDAARLARDLAEVDDLTTGELRQQYRDALSGPDGRRIRSLEASSAAEVVDIGLADADGDRPVVLAYLRQTTTTVASSDPAVQVTAIEATLSTVDGAWRVLRLEPVAGTGASDDDD